MIKEKNLKNIEEYSEVKQSIIGVLKEVKINKFLKLQKYIESKKKL